jgi:small-conductance mechanosensitive channel/CRP-like cAMP-binding protein
LKTYTPLFIEFAVMAVVWLFATVLARPLRRRLHREDPGQPAQLSLWLDVSAHLARPLLVLGLTELFLLALPLWEPAAAWLGAHLSHVTAWRMFWVGVSIVALTDGAAHAAYRARGRSFPVPDLLLDIIRAVLMLAVGLLVLRVELGVNIGPLLASTALLTAVIGFALQGVLGNLLAGMSLHLVRSLSPGVWVEVDGIEGKVVKTNWRETRIRARTGHLYILPNAKVAEARINNMNEPNNLRGHAVNVGASYSDAPDAVIAALLDAARSTPGVRLNPAPNAFVTAYLDFGINYRLTYWTAEYHKRVLIDGEVMRRIWYGFKRQGIEIPFPMSDQLLNDFMAVVYNQRRIPPSGQDTSALVADLWSSDLCRTLLSGPDGEPLVDRAALEPLAGLVERQLWTKGEVLCRQGDVNEDFWVLVSGGLDGHVEDRGHKVVQFALKPGAVVGEMSALTGVPRSATIGVSQGSTLLRFGAEAFKALLGLDPAVPEHLSELAAERAAQNREALEKLARERELAADVELEKDGILKRLLRKMKF